ncbi:MAG: ribonuclease HII [Firmicutes bacterium]|nr:ribonuclease HII [Bacillota bacterium]
MTKQERIEKMKEDLVRMMSYERELYSEGNSVGKVNYIAGVDEAGRGPLAGPVVAAAVILPEDFSLLGVNDSKKLSEKRRNELFDYIKETAVAWSVGIVDHETIDRINILNAAKEAMRNAVMGLSVRPDHVLIDAMILEGLDIPQTGIVKGDAKSVSIAAASIIAKVTRDRMMIEFGGQYPDYGFERNKGYGTKEHYAGLDRVGACPIHRQTFLIKYFANKK